MNPPTYPLIDTPVILVDDDEAFAAEFAEYLEAHGFRVTRLTTLHDLDEQIAAVQPALLVLDQFLGKLDSLTMLPRIRARFNGGILVLTGNQAPMDRVIGLELGADDFIPKTQPPREILARLHAVLRRVYAQPGVTWGQIAEPQAAAPAAPSATAWKLDTHRRELLAPDGSIVELTAAEFDLLAYLQAREGAVVSRDDLSMAVLRRKFLSNDRAVDNLVARIRVKLRPFLGERTLIKSVRAAGYVFVGFDAAD
jgi:DNA-binding response OmpR family regulator